MPRRFAAFVILISSLAMSGCLSSLLPRGKSLTAAPWDSYDQAYAAFARIEVGVTTEAELETLEFGDDNPTNVRVLNYTDVITRFIPSPAIAKEDLDPGILRCIEARNACKVFEYDVRKLDKKRYGNFLLDFFYFERNEEVRGWSVNALFLILDEVVVYKLWKGQPNILEYHHERNPLGPLQGAGPARVQDAMF
ncbi:MAG: hypothetical protein PHI49_02205 [Halothiobacillaceae bacterium]|jgi:hypothetical protein|nr:hypothetical protein [Halothiobacillaceae bacterium]